MRILRLLIVVWFIAPAAQAEDLELVSILRRLDQGSLAEKTNSVRRIGEIGPAAADAVPSLMKLLDIDDIGLRHEAIVALGNIGSSPNQVVPALQRFLVDPLPIIRFGAADALRKFGSDAGASVTQLIRLLSDNEPLIRVAAARAIVEIEAPQPKSNEQTIPVLIAGLKSDQHEISAAAIQGLAVVGSPAVAAIRDLVEGSNASASSNACDALASIGAHAAPALDRLMSAAGKESVLLLRSHAIYAIGEIGPEAASAVPILIAALGDADQQIVFAAGQSLHRIGKPAVPSLLKNIESEQLAKKVIPVIAEFGPEARDAVPALSRLLGSKDAEIRRESIIALAAIGADAKSVVPELIKLVKDPQFPNRPAAAYALGKIGDKNAIPVLKEAMQTQDNQTLRLACVWALLQFDPANEEFVSLAIPLLTKSLDNERDAVRIESAKSLGRMGARAKSAVASLQKKLSDPHLEVRRQSLIALAEIGADSSAAVSEIVRILNQGDPALRPISCYALGRIGIASKPAVPQLKRLLFSHDPHLKTLAAWALVSITPDAPTIELTIPILTAALATAESHEVRVELAKALGKIGSGSVAAKAALTAALKDSDEAVRKSAEAALNQLK